MPETIAHVLGVILPPQAVAAGIIMGCMALATVAIAARHRAIAAK